MSQHWHARSFLEMCGSGNLSHRDLLISAIGICWYDTPKSSESVTSCWSRSVSEPTRCRDAPAAPLVTSGCGGVTWWRYLCDTLIHPFDSTRVSGIMPFRCVRGCRRSVHALPIPLLTGAIRRTHTTHEPRNRRTTLKPLHRFASGGFALPQRARSDAAESAIFFTNSCMDNALFV